MRSVIATAKWNGGRWKRRRKSQDGKKELCGEPRAVKKGARREASGTDELAQPHASSLESVLSVASVVKRVEANHHTKERNFNDMVAILKGYDMDMLS